MAYFSEYIDSFFEVSVSLHSHFTAFFLFVEVFRYLVIMKCGKLERMLVGTLSPLMQCQNRLFNWRTSHVCISRSFPLGL